MNSNIFWAGLNLMGTVLNANAAARRWQLGQRKLAALSMGISIAQSVLLAQNVAAVINELPEAEDEVDEVEDPMKGETLISYPA